MVFKMVSVVFDYLVKVEHDEYLKSAERKLYFASAFMGISFVHVSLIIQARQYDSLRYGRVGERRLPWFYERGLTLDCLGLLSL